MSTFAFLKELEKVAIPRRLDTISEDVARQTEREQELQRRYDTLKRKLEDLQEAASAKVPVDNKPGMTNGNVSSTNNSQQIPDEDSSSSNSSSNSPVRNNPNDVPTTDEEISDDSSDGSESDKNINGRTSDIQSESV